MIYLGGGRGGGSQFVSHFFMLMSVMQCFDRDCFHEEEACPGLFSPCYDSPTFLQRDTASSKKLCACGTTTSVDEREHECKQFSCDQCDYRCSVSGNLSRHVRTHSGEKPFSCDQCDYRCSERGSLTKHMRMHSGEKPFSCDQCDYRCSVSGNLSRHVRTYSGEKPFSCDKCDYRCSERGSLTKHMRTHSGEKPFSCDQCDYRCSQRGNLTRHMRSHSETA